MTWSIKNTFASVNQIPPEVLSLIPEYCYSDEELINLTHVCRNWREIFTSRASLWTFLDCKDPEKTSVYLERSRACPLEIRLGDQHCGPFPNDALLLIDPHLGRLKALTIDGTACHLPGLIEHFSSPAPLLEKLRIRVGGSRIRLTESTLFGGNLSSLRELRLSGILTNLPWQNLSNLIVFDFRGVPDNTLSVAQLLDFFEGAPLLREIKLKDSLLDSPNAHAKRVVYLPLLRFLTITAKPTLSILLDHLRIPTGALVVLEFQFGEEVSPVPDHLPTPPNNFGNISHITSGNFYFGSGTAIRLKGPSGDLYAFGTQDGVGSASSSLGDRTLQSFNKLCISTIERLSITGYRSIALCQSEKFSTHQTLLLMNNLRALTLIDCLNLTFICALNPDHNTQNTMVCPELEYLVLYVQAKWDVYCSDQLVEMAKARASSGAKLSTIMLVCPREVVPAEKVFALKSHVSHVEYRLDNESPKWDTIPGEVEETYIEDSGW